jgi:hypothetical protein
MSLISRWKSLGSETEPDGAELDPPLAPGTSHINLRGQLRRRLGKCVDRFKPV